MTGNDSNVYGTFELAICQTFDYFRFVVYLPVLLVHIQTKLLRNRRGLALVQGAAVFG